MRWLRGWLRQRTSDADTEEELLHLVSNPSHLFSSGLCRWPFSNHFKKSNLSFSRLSFYQRKSILHSIDERNIENIDSGIYKRQRERGGWRGCVGDTGLEAAGLVWYELSEEPGLEVEHWVVPTVTLPWKSDSPGINCDRVTRQKLASLAIPTIHSSRKICYIIKSPNIFGLIPCWT